MFNREIKMIVTYVWVCFEQFDLINKRTIIHIWYISYFINLIAYMYLLNFENKNPSVDFVSYFFDYLPPIIPDAG